MNSLKLETPSSNQRAHFLELRVAQVGDDAVEGVVDGRLAVGLFHPRFERLPQALALGLNGEIDQRGRAADTPRQSCRSRNRPRWWCRRKACPDACARRCRPASPCAPPRRSPCRVFDRQRLRDRRDLAIQRCRCRSRYVSVAVTTLPFLITVSKRIQLLRKETHADEILGQSIRPRASRVIIHAN